MKRKTAHSIRITLATKLFQGGTEEKLIRQRTGHRSDLLLRYERPSGSQLEKVSSVLGSPNSCVTMPIHSVSNTSLSCPDPFVGNVPNFQFNLVDDCGSSSVHDEVTDEILSVIDIPSSITNECQRKEVSEFYQYEVSDELLSEVHIPDFASEFNNLWELDRDISDDILGAIQIPDIPGDFKNVIPSSNELTTVLSNPVFKNCTINFNINK